MGTKDITVFKYEYETLIARLEEKRLAKALLENEIGRIESILELARINYK